MTSDIVLLEEKNRIWLEREFTLPSGTTVSLREVGPKHDWYIELISEYSNPLSLHSISPWATPAHMQSLREIIQYFSKETPPDFIIAGLLRLSELDLPIEGVLTV